MRYCQLFFKLDGKIILTNDVLENDALPIFVNLLQLYKSNWILAFWLLNDPSKALSPIVLSDVGK